MSLSEGVQMSGVGIRYPGLWWYRITQYWCIRCPTESMGPLGIRKGNGRLAISMQNKNDLMTGSTDSAPIAVSLLPLSTFEPAKSFGS